MGKLSVIHKNDFQGNLYNKPQISVPWQNRSLFLLVYGEALPPQMTLVPGAFLLEALPASGMIQTSIQRRKNPRHADRYSRASLQLTFCWLEPSHGPHSCGGGTGGVIQLWVQEDEEWVSVKTKQLLPPEQSRGIVTIREREFHSRAWEWEQIRAQLWKASQSLHLC